MPTSQQLGCVATASLNIRIEAVLEWLPLKNILSNISLPQMGPEIEPVYRGTISRLEDLDLTTYYQ